MEPESKFNWEEDHPFFHHPAYSTLPRFAFKWGPRGKIGLEVQDEWWKLLCGGGELGELAKIKDYKDYPCGTTRLVMATLPYSEFGPYYRRTDYEQMTKQRQLIDKQLEVNGWKRKIEGDSEIRNPWSRVEHKYFSVSHRSI